MNSDVLITGEKAIELAKLFQIPYKEPVWEFVVDVDGQMYLGYDSGLDYEGDGYTYEAEWKLDHKILKDMVV